jgi:phosphatidylglycerol:prolipoprotein diacylglycerol transferase
MWHTLLHIYGPFAIHGYGLMIAIGLLIFIHLVQQDPRFERLAIAPYFNTILLFGIIIGLLGGRTLFFIVHPELYDNLFGFLSFFNGGFSILGCILALLFALPLYLRYLRIPVIPFLDLIALYSPLLQSISRIGCFLAGCCYGVPTTLPWGITYTCDSIAPLYTCLHPTQLYSALILLLIFALLYFVIQHQWKQKGQLVCWYVLLVGLERFIVEFWRGDRISTDTLTLNHYIAASMVISAIIGLAITQFYSTKK